MILTAGTVLTGASSLGAGWVEIASDRIVGVGSGTPARPADLDLGDAIVAPGFVDMHVHGGGGGAFFEATDESVDAALALHRRHGTTAMMASLVSDQPEALARQVSDLADRVEAGDLLGIHLEGPWLAARRGGAHEPAALRDPDPEEVRALLEAGRGAVRMVTLAPELPGALEAIRRIVDAGAVAAIGAPGCDLRTGASRHRRRGDRRDHLFNAMRPVHHREPGPVVAALEDPRVTVKLIIDGVHLHPALHRLVTADVGVDRVALVTDAMAAAGMEDGAYRLGSLAVDVTDGVAHVAGTDTIAGSTATMARMALQAVTHSAGDRDEALLTVVRQVPQPLARPGAGARPCAGGPGRSRRAGR